MKATTVEYLPVRDLSLLLDARLWGARPFGYHLTNLLLYLAGLAAFYYMIRNLSSLTAYHQEDSVAFWTTLVFALHPLHVEVVSSVWARNNILAGLFLFLSFNTLMAGVHRQARVLILLSSVFFVAALFSKASAVFYPLFLGMVFLYVPDTLLPVRKKVLIVLSFLALDSAAIWIHLSNASGASVLNENYLRFGSGSPALIAAKALQIPFYYLRMLVLPYPMSFQYYYTFLSDGYVLRSVLAGAAVVALLLLIWMLRKKSPLAVFGIAWYLLSLGPVSNIFPTTPVVADRYAYFAVAGFGLVSVLVVKELQKKSGLVAYAAIACLVVWSGIDVSRIRDWRNDITLWESAVSVDGRSRRNLGDALWERGRYDEALAQFKQLRDLSGDFRYHQHMGRYLALSGRYGEALSFYQKALAEGGDAWKEPHLDIAEAYEKLGKYPEALEHNMKVIDTVSFDFMARNDRKAKDAIARIRDQYLPKGEELRLRADREPANLRAQWELAFFFHRLGMFEEAGKAYGKVLELYPSSWEAWYNLGLTYMKRARWQEAVRSFDKSLEFNPRNRDALNNVGICYLSMRDYELAARYYRKALDIDPAFFFAAFNLGRVYFITGNREQAKKYFSTAVRIAGENQELKNRMDPYLAQLR
jgi:tetratricopeptide (TPR) repeat protein